jgi:hypothetical protein
MGGHGTAHAALVTIPAMIEVILSAGLVPTDVAIRTHRASNPTGPQTWASRIHQDQTRRTIPDSDHRNSRASGPHYPQAMSLR